MTTARPIQIQKRNVSNDKDDFNDMEEIVQTNVLVNRSQVYVSDISVWILFAVLMVLFGCGLNGGKYLRYSTSSCKHGILMIKVDNSEYCCDEKDYITDWSCIGGYSDVNHFMTSFWSWIIPFLPILCTLSVDLFLMTGKFNWRPHKNRVLAYFVLFLYRSVWTYQQFYVILVI